MSNNLADETIMQIKIKFVNAGWLQKRWQKTRKELDCPNMKKDEASGIGTTLFKSSGSSSSLLSNESINSPVWFSRRMFYHNFWYFCQMLLQFKRFYIDLNISYPHRHLHSFDIRIFHLYPPVLVLLVEHHILEELHNPISNYWLVLWTHKLLYARKSKLFCTFFTISIYQYIKQQSVHCSPVVAIFSKFQWEARLQLSSFVPHLPLVSFLGRTIFTDVLILLAKSLRMLLSLLL